MRGLSARPDLHSRGWRLLVVGIVALLVVQSVGVLACRWQTATSNPLDFAMRGSSVHLLLHGYNPYRIQRLGLRSSVRREIWAEVRHFDPHYLPSALTPMIPCALPDFDTAVLAWWWTNLLAGFFCSSACSASEPGRGRPSHIRSSPAS